MNVSATVPDGNDIVVPPKLTKTDDPEYNPVFDFEHSSWKTMYDNIVSKSSDIHDIGKLPNFEEFCALTGYSSLVELNLTDFRQKYGIGTEFVVPTDNITIYIANESELDLLANLVNDRVDGEVTSEQAYYSTGNYKLYTQIDYTGTTYEPIGTAEYPFNGTFDGDGYEIDNIKLIDDVESRAVYSGYDYLGLFGYVGSQGCLRNIGLTNMTLTAKYVLGGDAAFVCARNYGIIENCYVNGKQTSKLNISNSTAGGICGENYGTIKGCYADAWVDVATHSGTYSEPQPIATVNHGGTITNCYYIRQSFLNLFINKAVPSPFERTLTSDVNDGTILGWKYTGDRSQINGTPLSYTQFFTQLHEKSDIYGNGLIKTTVNSAVSAYAGLFSLDTLLDNFGTGDTFDLDGNTQFPGECADRYIYGMVLKLSSRDDWNRYCKLVNKEMPNETDAEQEFWSNLSVTLIGEKRTINNKSVEVFDLYQDDKSLGTSQYKFNGRLDFLGNRTICLHLENQGSGVVSPIFGYNAGTINLGNVMVVGNDISGYMNGALICGTNEGTFNTFTMLDNSYRVTSDNSGVSIVDSNANYSTLADMNYNGITILGSNVGGSFACNQGFAYQWYSASVVPVGYNYLLITNNVTGGTVSGRLKVTSASETTNSYGTRVTTTTVYSIKSISASNSYTNTAQRSVSTFTKSFVYPSLSAPEFSNNEYKIRSDKNLLWLFKYATGDNARLMNTIDLFNYTFQGTPFTGWFNLDGTLTDHNDVCDAVNLGVTKCYGILNMTVNDTILTSANNGINWSNVYFIGGSFTSNTYLKSNHTNKRWFGNTLSNVHVSFDMVYNQTPNSSSYIYTASNIANGCSISSRCIVNNCNCYICPLANTATDCVSYTTLVYNTVCYSVTNLANEAYHCICRVSTEKNPDITNIGLIPSGGGIGRRAENCLADGVYNFRGSNKVPVKLFAITFDSVNCTFSGEYYGPTDKVNNVASIGSGTSGFVGTPECKIDGIVQITSDSSKSNMIFRGTYDVYVPSTRINFFGTYGTNLLSDGTIHIHPDTFGVGDTLPESSKLKSTYGFKYRRSDNQELALLGFQAQNSVFNSTVDFVGFEDNNTAFDTFVIYVTGAQSRGNVVNYSDFNVDVKCLFNGVYLTYGGNNSSIVNYGNVNIGENSYFKTVRLMEISNNTVAKNFGDLTIRGGYELDAKLINSGNLNATATNYGSIDFKKMDNSEIVNISALNFVFNGVNYGDITLDFNNYSNACYFLSRGCSSGINLGNIEFKNLKNTTDSAFQSVIQAGGTENYGNISVHDIECKYNSTPRCSVYVGSLANDGFIDTEWHGIMKSTVSIHDVTAELVQYLGGFRATRYYNNLTATEYVISDVDLDIDHVVCTNMKICNGLTTSGYSYSGNVYQKLYRADTSFYDFKSNLDIDILNDIDIHDIEVKNVFKYVGVFAYLNINDKGFKRNFSHFNLSDSTIKKIEYSGIASNSSGIDHNPWISQSDVTINNVVLSKESIISGVLSNSFWNTIDRSGCNEIMPISNAFNFGTMNINVTGAKIRVNGISDGSQVNTCADISCPFVLNACDINVTNNREIVINGIMGNDSYNKNTSYVHNAINSGNLSATLTNTSYNVYINGITDSAYNIKSVENFGTISTSAKRGKIAAICGDIINTVAGWVNYGTVDVSSFNSGQIITTVMANSSTSNLGYGINYGTFTKANSNNTGNLKFIVDLSGNKATIPNGTSTFSTDSSITGVAAKEGKGYNDFEEVINNTGSLGEDTSIAELITYNTFIDPDFGFRYNNFISTKYLTSVTKEQYNGDNLFEYATVDNTCGMLRTKVDSFSGAGGYVLGAVAPNGNNLMGVALEQMMFTDKIVTDTVAWFSDYSVHRESYNNYVINTLKQRNTNSLAEIFEVNISSVDLYETQEGSTQIVQNTSTLTPFQAPVKTEGIYSDENTVTIVDLYVLSNTFKNIENTNINWTFNITGSQGMTLKMYDTPKVYDTVSTFKQGIEQLSGSLETASNGANSTLLLKEIGGVTYAIVGYMEAEDGIHHNLIAVRLHSNTTQPMGWLTTFNYATGVNTAGTSLVYSDALKGSKGYYDTVRGTEAFTGDLYTVSRGHTETYSYPIYNFTTPMVRSTSGSIVGYRPNIYFTGDINYSFDVQNCTSFRVKITGDRVFEGTDTPPIEGIASADGTVIIKNNILIIREQNQYSSDNIIMKNVETDEYIKNRYDSLNNPFVTGGNKKIEVFGTADTGDEIKLFEINIFKELNFENYILSANLVRRNWFGAASESPNGEFTEALDYYRFYEQYFKDDPSYLATKHDDSIEISTLKSHGSYTKYPEYTLHSQGVTAEDGSDVMYTETIRNVDFDVLDFTGVGGLDNCYNKDGTVVINDDSNIFSYNAYTNVNKVKRLTASRSFGYSDFLVEKFDIYVDGQYVRTVDTLIDNSRPEQGIIDTQWGITVRVGVFSFNTNADRRITIIKDNTVSKADLPDVPISIKPYIYYDMPNNERIQIECGLTSFIKALNPDRQLISVNTQRALTSTYISEFSDAEAVNVDFDVNNNVVYAVDYTTLPNLYISDVVEPNCSATNVSYGISPCASLEQKISGVWTKVFSATSGNYVYNTFYNFTQEGLGVGYTYEYRIVAQDFTAEDEEKVTHITYFTHNIGATTRNKVISIEFKEDDTTTMQLYNEIIASEGNLSIQLKNMNLNQIKFQQTKFYVNDMSLESNYYNIAQGDYAILVNIPDGYNAQIKIVGGSTEGYLTESPNVKGKRLRLPYANSQVIKLEVTLSRVTVDTEWGVVLKRSTSVARRINNV